MITIDDFKQFFIRDFPYLPAKSEYDENYISDKDIERAIMEMGSMLPVAIFEEENNVLKLAQLYLTAHCLVDDIRTSNSGLASSYEFPVQSKSVQGVSVSYGIPTNYLQKEVFSFYIASKYGLKYLALAIPRIKGRVRIASGWTLP